MDIAFFIIRLVLGAAIAAHGAQKLFGWFGGYGLKGTAGWMESLGYRPAVFFTLAAGLSEVGGGVLTALGLGGPIGPALIVLVMVVAIATVHIANGFFQSGTQNGAGYELNTLYILSAASIAYAGFGSISLDRVIGFDLLSAPLSVTIALVAGAVMGLINANLRSKAPVSAN
jgi:putative oxidoreductase